MEEIALILAALAAGAAAAAKDTAGQVVKDAYAGLKSLVQEWFAEKEKPEGEMALAKYEEKQEVWEAPLKDALIESEIGKAKEIVQAAEALKQVLEQTPEGREAVSKYLVNVRGGEVGLIGDHAQVGTIQFGNRKDS